MEEDVSASQLDDFQVIAERLRVIEAIAALTARCKELNQAMTRRETLRWMRPSRHQTYIHTPTAVDNSNRREAPSTASA
ncbi:MAG TPA: hypothetical protein VF223_15555 [Trebonia sp.]